MDKYIVYKYMFIVNPGLKILLTRLRLSLILCADSHFSQVYEVVALLPSEHIEKTTNIKFWFT